MRKLVYIIGFVIIGITSIQAQNKNAKATLEVDGVCGSCKSRIERNTLQVKGVKYAVWDKNTHYLNLIIDERKTNLNKIQKAIAAAGHDNRTLDVDNEEIASDEAYQSISDCCKYRDAEVVENHP